MTLFKIFPPKSINSFYGYRTSNSMKSQAKWDFAQKFSATLSLILLSPSVIIQALLYYLYGSTTIINRLITFYWVLSFAIVIYKTEKKTKKISD
ncbi:hypothetical protein DCO46_20195 [Flavobacterium sp. HTF]|nr:hypothetical protein DCO46_20195 [Flavobacterium sp. HTF]